jgi:hypothetical protein
LVLKEASESHIKDVKYYGFADYTVIFSQNDTFAAPDFVTTANPSFVVVINNATGAQITCTYVAGTNVITVTGACTDAECTVWVYGVRA